MQNVRNFFLKSHSCPRLAFLLVFLFFVFGSLYFDHVQSHDDPRRTALSFCSDGRKKGHRLNSAVHERRFALSPTDCVVQCVREKCCRSTNYRISYKDDEENCELLHAVLSEEEPENLKEDNDYNYNILLKPVKSFSCDCSSCENNGKCDESNKSCLCRPGFHGTRCQKVQKSCADLYSNGVKADGVYTIDPDGAGAFNISCDMTTDGGSWTVFQRRMDGSVDFYLNWTDYKSGFGNLSGEFWLGLDKLNRLTKSGQNVLRVDLEDFEGEKRYAKYNPFAVADENLQYNLTVGDYSGNATDSLSLHNGMMFSTKDKDNDKSSGSCATQDTGRGAWWYNNCWDSNLNGFYYPNGSDGNEGGVAWEYWRGDKVSLKKSEMKLQRRN